MRWICVECSKQRAPAQSQIGNLLAMAAAQEGSGFRRLPSASGCGRQQDPWPTEFGCRVEVEDQKDKQHRKEIQAVAHVESVRAKRFGVAHEHYWRRLQIKLFDLFEFRWAFVWLFEFSVPRPAFTKQKPFLH